MTSIGAINKPFSIEKRRVYEAYKAVKSNRGAAGVDEQTLEMFETDLAGNLYKIWNRMSSGTYFPPPVRAVSIPKKTGGERILGVPTVSDRIRRYPSGDCLRHQKILQFAMAGSLVGARTPSAVVYTVEPEAGATNASLPAVRPAMPGEGAGAAYVPLASVIVSMELSSTGRHPGQLNSWLVAVATAGSE